MARSLPAKPKLAVSACSGVRDRPCEVCGTNNANRPMVFRGEDYCSDLHRKVIIGEIAPTLKEWASMDRSLYKALEIRWGGVIVRDA